MVKKRKLPGENISLKTKKTESTAVMEWINAQTNLMDSIRYLVENEIRLNGVRNLQLIIPSQRSSLFASAVVPSGESVATKASGEPLTVQTADEIDDEDIESWI